MSLSGWNTNNILQLVVDSNKVDSDITNYPLLITLSSGGCGINDFDASEVFEELSYANRKKLQ